MVNALFFCCYSVYILTPLPFYISHLKVFL